MNSLSINLKNFKRGLLQYIKRKGNDKYPNPQQDNMKPGSCGEREEDIEYEEIARQVNLAEK